VSQYVAEGLPVRSDGKLNREEAFNWIGRNHSDSTGSNKGVGRANTLLREDRRRPSTTRRVPACYGNREPDPYLESLADRARNWREIHVGRRYGNRIPIDVAATMFAAGDRDAVLIWLRVGLPYAVEGNWETGEGFWLAISWMMEWGVHTTMRADASGDWATARELRLDCFGESGRWTPEIAAKFEAATGPTSGGGSR